MKAWQFTTTHQPFSMVDLENPVAESGEVVIEVKAAGLCHSDVGILQDEKWLETMSVPVVPGHEVSGTISEVGTGVTDWQLGDRVAIWPIEQRPGYDINGGWAEKIRVSTKSLVPIPQEVSFAQAAVATDAGMTSHSAVVVAADLKPGMRIGIIGFGGLGQIGTRLAYLNQAEVYVAEINEKLWDNASNSGAVKVASSILAFAEDRLDIIIDFAGFGTTTAEAIEAVRPGGRVIQVGMGKLSATINTNALIRKKVHLIGSVGGTKCDIAQVMKWIASGELTPQIHDIGFEDIPAGIEQLRRGEVVGRLVALF